MRTTEDSLFPTCLQERTHVAKAPRAPPKLDGEERRENRKKKCPLLIGCPKENSRLKCALPAPRSDRPIGCIPVFEPWRLKYLEYSRHVARRIAFVSWYRNMCHLAHAASPTIDASHAVASSPPPSSLSNQSTSQGSALSTIRIPKYNLGISLIDACLLGSLSHSA